MRCCGSDDTEEDRERADMGQEDNEEDADSEDWQHGGGGITYGSTSITHLHARQAITATRQQWSGCEICAYER